MQKLVTIYVDSNAYMEGKWLKGSHADKHGMVEQHLEQDLAAGWTVKSLFAFGGAGDLNARGWLAVVLEKA